MKDLRRFLREWGEQSPSDVCRIHKGMSVKYEITTLAAKLEKNDLYPALLIEKPITAQGKESTFPVITNLVASRRRCAAALGISPREVAQGFAAKNSQRIPPEIVNREQAPVKAVVKKGSDINLYELPVLVHHEGTSGARFTGAMATTMDPATGIDNCALQSATIREKDKLSWSNGGASHNALNMKAWWRKGEDCPIAFWIGHHPAASLGGQQILGHPESHYPGIGGLLGEPLRLVPTETFGEKLLVPADAEIVIEGYAPKDGWVSGAYAGDHAKTMIPMGPVPEVRVTAITHRKDAYYHDIGVGHADNLVMGGFALEAAVYETCKKVAPSVQNVHLPLSGLCRRIVYVQVKDPSAGEARAIISTGLNVDTRIKYIYVVDDDVDIFDDREVTLALVNRAQIDRDMVILSGLPDTAIDPVALRMGDGYVTAKAGYDLTLPPPPLPGFPKQFEEGIRFPREVEEKLRIEDYLSMEDLRRLEKESQ
jgi:2,5-furandicarboxylate decarboxylase 1